MVKLQNYLATILLSASALVAHAQQHRIDLNWQINADIQADPEIVGQQKLSPFWCISCKESIQDEYIIPYTVIRIDDAQDISDIRLIQVNVESHESKRISPYLTSDFTIEKTTAIDRGRTSTYLKIIPIRNNGRGIDMLRSCVVEYDIVSPSTTPAPLKKKDQTYVSVLTSGDIYKISIESDGVYRIDADFLDQQGIDPASVQMSTFKIYGNGGNMLPEVIADFRHEDLAENALYEYDENGNGVFDGNDYILWYAQGPTSIWFNENGQYYDGRGHYYDDKAYYFMTWGGNSGKRINTIPSNSGTSVDAVIDNYDHVIFHERNEENHIKSGRRWWGDKMQQVTIKEFDYSLAGIVPGSNTKFKTTTGVRSLVRSDLYFSITGNNEFKVSHGTVSGEYDENFIAGPQTTVNTFTVPGNDFTVTYRYNKLLHDAAAWIDYFILAPKRTLAAYDDQQVVYLHSHTQSGNIQYDFDQMTGDHMIWNITDHTTPAMQQTFDNSGKRSCIYTGIDQLSAPQFVLFDRTKAYTPAFVGLVPNQNLHALQDIEYLIVTRTDLKDEADRLADFHRTFNGLTVAVVTTDKIYNEFSSGSQDITAIRDLAKLLYDRGNTSGIPLKHILLFGDASYDYKDIEANNTNVVPIYQSPNSFNPPNSYCSDDYYAILDDHEGYWGLSNRDEVLDIGVGRLPASNVDEARIMVDKILHYHDEASLGNWSQTLTFLADDENGNDHVGPSEGMTTLIGLQSPEFNIKKIWLDAYEQVSYGSGNKYPEVNQEVNKVINDKGTLIFNYVGHGGENGMAHERVVTRPEISAWSNYDKLSFYITASCELAKIDNLSIESPGELMLLNPNGGAIGMVATTRVVYIGTNTDLNFEIINDNLLSADNNQLPDLGDAYRKMRNADPWEEINKRCFMLLADPAMRLHYPRYNVVTTKINGKPIGQFNDTLSALGLVSIEGEIRDLNNQISSNYNGTLYPTFYDKPSTYRTLGNDPQSYPIDFEMQDRVIYKGQVSVVNGKFSFQFVVPKDIAYNVGYGKLSYYAKDALIDAGGSEKGYLIGGTSDSLKNDKEPPSLKLFIDDRSWVFGGTTSSTPTLLADVYDENGINTIGSGIGREMEAIIDAGTDDEQSIILNDYYTPKLNSYKEGVIEFPFSELKPGKHTLSLKVWDVYNNSAQDYTEFVVSENGALALNNILNYPNPFNRYTEFHFDHNKAGQTLDVNITITSVAGNVVHSIQHTVLNAPSHINSPGQVIEELTWDGRDRFGDRLANGVYIYTIEVRSEDGYSEKKTQKLFLIN